MTDTSEPDAHAHPAAPGGMDTGAAHYRSLVENIPQRVFYKDLQSRYVAVNSRYAEDMGVAPQDMVGKDDFAFHPREMAERYRRDDRRVMESGRVEEFDESYFRDGREFVIHTTKTPVRDADGRIIGVCGIFQDVTEQRRTEARLRESEATLRAVYEHAQDGILVASAETRRFIMANPAIRRMLGYSETELMGMSPDDLHPPEVLPRVREHFRAMERGEFSPYREMPFQRKDGGILYLDVHASLVTIQGSPCFFGVFRDVTDQLSAQEALARGEALLAEAQALAHLGNWNLDLVTGQATWSDEEYRLLGYQPGSVTPSGEHFMQAVHPEDREAVAAEMRRAMTPGETRPYHIEHRVVRPDGVRTVEQRGRIVLDAAGKPSRMHGTTLDITERKATQEALLRSEETYAQAEAITHIGSWDWDITSGGLRWTDEIYRIFGLTPQSFGATYQAFLEAVHPEDRQRVIDAVNASVADASVPYSVEHRVVRPDGEIRIVHERGNIYRGPDGAPARMIGTVHDVTEQKAAEAELARYRARLEERVRERTAEVERASRRNAIIVGAAMDGFFSASLDGRVNDCNEAYCRMLGYTLEEMLALNVSDLEADESPEEMAAHVRKIMEAGRDHFDTRHRRKDSGFVHVEVNVSLEEIGGEPFFFAFVHDITARKQNEAALTRAKEEAERANRAKSEFLSRMSHELRTPLNAILGFGQLLELDPLEAEQTDNVQEILHAGRHLLELINEVLDLARIEAGRLTISQEPVPLMPLMEECLTLIRPMAEKGGISIATTGRDCGEQVRADRTRLKQVFLNLLANAVKYNRQYGSISIACIHDEGAIQVRISDTGKGLTPERQARLFSPFERLDADRQAIEGTGIGLALSKRLVELMQGEIGVESTPGTGSTFWVRLPLVQGHEQAGEAGEGQAIPSLEVAPPSRGNRRLDILYIEDNPANLRLVERIFSRRNDIRLLTASTPTLGLELAMAYRPGLILLDINLPEMDGYDVMKCLQENPATQTIPVVAVSANAMPADLARGKAAGFLQYLTKPLAVGKLLEVVDAVSIKQVGDGETGDTKPPGMGNT